MIFSALVFLGVVGQCDLRFTCYEGHRLAGTYRNSFLDIQEILMRSRELAIQAANGTLGQNDRIYLQDELDALTTEFDRIVDYTFFQDSFGSRYSPLLDGLKFILSYKSAVSESMLVAHFDFPRISSDVLGRLANQVYGLYDSRLQETDLLIALEINDQQVTSPRSWDDTVSTELNWASSIAWARAINSNQGRTGVRAIVEDTVLPLSINLSAFPLSRETIQKLEINRVSLLANSVNSLEELIYAINDFSNSTGVKARSMLSPHGSVLELYGDDGRNIVLDLRGSSELKNLFHGEVSADQKYVRVGRISLRSSKPINVTDVGGVFGVGQNSWTINVDGQGLKGLDLLSAASAADALAHISAALAQYMQLEVTTDHLLRACPNPMP